VPSEINLTGCLFAVNDDKTPVVFSANDVTYLPIFTSDIMFSRAFYPEFKNEKESGGPWMPYHRVIVITDHRRFLGFLPDNVRVVVDLEHYKDEQGVRRVRWSELA
jgi:hypothetical protein